MFDVLTQEKVRVWREKAVAGSLTLDDCREAYNLLRQGRLAAQEAAAKSKASGKKASKAPPRAADDMLKDLGV